MSNNIILKRQISGRMQNKKLFYSQTDFDKCGWLKKQGGTFKTMKRRYFVLINDVLYYFTNETKGTLKGQIYLRNLELSELEEDRGSGEYIFSILPELGKDCVNKTHDRFQLVCNDKKNAESWLQHIKQNIYLHRDGGLFGTPLNTVRKYLKAEYSYVPRVVFECCQRIRAIGMDEEGIFRKNGQQSLVYQLKENIDRARYIWEGVDIHTICSLLKLYLRELPEPLIPFSQYDGLKAVGYRIESGEDLDLVRNKLRQLPPPNLQLLKYLCEFLLEVSTHQMNRMEIPSLAKVFSPNILRNQDTDPYIEESSSSLISITVAAFIRSQTELFIFEYEPLENDDRVDSEPANEQDTYSIGSVISNMGFVAACFNFDDANNVNLWLPKDQNDQRVKSMIFPDHKCSDNIPVSSTFSKSNENMNKLKPVTYHGEYVAMTPLSLNPVVKTIDPSGSVCTKCQSLEGRLLSVTEERDTLQQLCNIKTEMCAQYQKEIDDLRFQLSENAKSKGDNVNDLSEVLAYFKMNR